jgi:hypothetical protein
MVNGGRKRTVMTHYEGGGVKVDDGRKRTTTVRSEGGGVEVDGLRKRTATARSEAGVEAMACYEAGDEVVMCSGARIEDARRRQHQR